METTSDISYFRWITGKALKWCAPYGSYRQLIQIMQLTPFYSKIELDKNRVADAMDLRTRFGKPVSMDEPCSVLEVMVALASRCENEIMTDPDMGDRTGFWFFSMVQSLGLAGMTDERFDVIFTITTLDKFLKRDFKPNGEGSLFTIHNSDQDFRNTEIWYQMCWYLDEVTGK